MMRRLLLTLLLLCGCDPAFAQQQFPFNSFETKPGTAGVTACDIWGHDGPYYVQSTGEIWECDSGTWQLLALQSTAVPADHATDHMSGGVGGDPLAVFLQTWTRAHTFTPSTNETAITANATGSSQTADIITVTDKSADDAFSVADTGQVLVNDASENARLSVKGKAYAPDPEIWLKASDVANRSLTCGVGYDSGTSMTGGTTYFVDLQGNYTLTGTHDGQNPQYVCGRCATDALSPPVVQWAEGDGSYLSDNCDFSLATGIGSHVQLLDSYFALSPSIDIAPGQTWTFVGLFWGSTQAGSTGLFWGDAGDDRFELWNHGGANDCTSYTDSVSFWKIHACDGTAPGVPLQGDCVVYPLVGSCTGGTGNNECSDGSQSSLGEGPGDWYVASIQITMAAAEATLSVFNINGTDVRTGGADVLLGAGCTDYTFEIDRLFWDNIMVAEFIGWDEALSADAISTAENYLAYTYTLGAGLDPVNDSMDSADVDVQIESIFYGESVEAGEYLEVESDARTVIVRAGDSDYSEQLKLCSGSGETNCVAFEADANGDAVITPDGGDATVVADLTIGDGTAADITLTFDTDGTESLFWDDSESGFTPSAKWTFAGGDRTIFEIRQFGTPFGLDYTASSGSLAQYTFQHLFEAQDGVGGTRTLLRMTGGVSGVFNVIAPSISFDGFVAFTAINVTAGTGGQGTGVLTKTVNVITSASANDDVTLPSHTSGRVIWAFNQSGVAVDMYPPANDAINGLAVDALITLKAGYVNVCSSTATSLVWVCLEAALPAS